MIHLAIMLNNCASNDPCAICGRRTDPDIGPEIFLADSLSLVCHRCGGELAPKLLHLLYLGGAADRFAAAVSGVDADALVQCVSDPDPF